jgi:HK97 family phage major capsid protein
LTRPTPKEDTVSDYVKSLIDERQKAWHQAKEILDRCVADKRERTAEENEMFERANADIERLGREIDEHKRMAEIERENDVAREAFAGLVRPEIDHSRSMRQMSALERFLRTGDTSGLQAEREGSNVGVMIDLVEAARVSQAIRGGMDAAEVRALYTDTGTSGTLVPTTFVRSLYQYMEASSAVRRLSRVITTAGGENMDFPKVLAHGIGTQVIAQGTAIGGTDPTFSKITLGAYKYGQLVKLSNEAVADSAVDILGFVAENIGRALGRITDTAYVTGNGTTAPNGIVTAAGTGVKTGGTLIPLDFDDLIDLEHSVVAEYRENAAWVMNDSTAGSLRKLRAGAGDAAGTVLGEYLWEPSRVVGQPDRLHGYPVYTDGNFAAQGSAARAVAFGDWSAYYVRDVQGVRLERSDERYFDTDEIGFRGVLRTDADLADANAIKTSAQQA